jgi:hypothetical protein
MGRRSERVVAGRLDDHDLGSEIAEHAAGDRARLAGEVDDPHALEQPARHQRFPFCERAEGPFS